MSADAGVDDRTTSRSSGSRCTCELATATKLFCGCPNEFGAEPNTHVCPVCLGLPGSLPVLNEQAVEFALRLGEALHCDVPEQSIFHAEELLLSRTCRRTTRSRSTTSRSASTAGSRSTAARIGIERAHLEEDTGKTQHVGGRRPHPRRRPLARRLQPRRRAAHGDREPSRHPQRRAGAVRTSAELRGVLAGHRRVRREDGGGLDAGRRQRVGPPGRRRRSSAPRSRSRT